MKHFEFICCVNPSHVFKTDAKGVVVARLRAHSKGWASTSMDSPTAKDICPECVKHHPSYEPKGRRLFRRSVFASLHRFVMGGSFNG